MLFEPQFDKEQRKKQITTKCGKVINLIRRQCFFVKGRSSMSKRDKIPFYDCYLLTVEEAAAYFHIGNRKFYEVVSNNRGAKWILYNGRRIMIKKDLFAKWIDQQTVI